MGAIGCHMCGRRKYAYTAGRYVIAGRTVSAPGHRTSYAVANKLVARLTELGILQKMTGYSRNRQFRYEPYVHLFRDEPSEGA